MGYRVRFDEKLSEHTRIKFLTDGMLLQWEELAENSAPELWDVHNY